MDKCCDIYNPVINARAEEGTHVTDEDEFIAANIAGIMTAGGIALYLAMKRHNSI